MLAPRVPSQSGNRLEPFTHHVLSKCGIPSLRTRAETWITSVTIVPNTPEIINVHNYQAMYYPDGSYAGINEIVFDFKPWLDCVLTNN